MTGVWHNILLKLKRKLNKGEKFMDNKLLNRLKNMIFADGFVKGKEWNGYVVYEPVYKTENIGGFPKIILEKDGAFRLSNGNEVFEYMKFKGN